MVFGLIGFVFNVATFPGVLVNNVVQGWVDNRYRVPRERVAFDGAAGETSGDDVEAAVRSLGPGEDPAGGAQVERFVHYDGVQSYGDLFKVVLSPLAVTSLVGATVLVATAWALHRALLDPDGLLWLVPFWLGFSVLAHAFPNRQPTDALWRASRETSSALRALAYPVVGASKLVNLLEFVWIDAVYALAVWYAAIAVFPASPA